MSTLSWFFRLTRHGCIFWDQSGQHFQWELKSLAGQTENTEVFKCQKHLFSRRFPKLFKLFNCRGIQKNKIRTTYRFYPQETLSRSRKSITWSDLLFGIINRERWNSWAWMRAIPNAENTRHREDPTRPEINGWHEIIENVYGEISLPLAN